MRKILLLLGVALLFASCQSEMQVVDPIEPFGLEESAKPLDMEFIGFKAGDGQWDDGSRIHWGQMKTTPPIRNFGSELQNAGIATDKSDVYVGVYSFEELQKYKSKNRYVTYVEIPDFQMKYTLKNLGAKDGGVILCMTVFLLPIGAIMAATPAKTDMYFKSSANIYVYDTQTLELVYKKTVFINEQKEFLGYFSKGCLYFGESSEAGKQKVYEYWANVLANKALEEYNNVKKSPLFAEVQDNNEEQSEEKQE